MNESTPILAPGQFPINASDLKLSKYAAPDTIGRLEEEEAAVRLLMFSLAEGKFVGVAWNNVMQIAADEGLAAMKHNEEVSRINDANFLAMSAYYKEKKIYRNWAFFTLGISMIFMNEPIKPNKESLPELPQDQKQTFSIVSLYGPMGLQMLINAFWELVKKQLVIKEEHNGIDYFFPTPQLVGKIAGI